MTELEALREENDRLKAAIEWATDKSCRNEIGNVVIHAETLLYRAFPEPETEEVEVVRWGLYYEEDNRLIATFDDEQTALNIKRTEDFPCYMIRFTGTRTIPKPCKVKRREEIYINDPVKNVRTYNPNGAPLHAKFFAEWEE